MRLSLLSPLLLGILPEVGYGSGPTAPLEMTTLNPRDDHETIAYHYRHKAVLARLQIEELADQLMAYELDVVVSKDLVRSRATYAPSVPRGKNEFPEPV